MLGAMLKAAGVYKAYARWLEGQVRRRPMPTHVAVILDGNRRWAMERYLPLFEGHVNGAAVGESFLEWCMGLGIETVTVYIFSTENYNRPREEVEKIFSIIEEEARKLGDDPRIWKNEVRIKTIGRSQLLPPSLRQCLTEIEDKTRHFNKHYLNIAVAYGGRAELIDAARKIAEDARGGRIDPSEIDEGLFRKYLYTADLPHPDPDLIIRTSGEERLSGFLLFQSAYSELCFLDVYWPGFRRIDFLRAIRTFQQRRRRFGT